MDFPFWNQKGRLDDQVAQLRRAVEENSARSKQNSDRIDDHEVRIQAIEGMIENIHALLDEFSGYPHMSRDDLLQITGALHHHEQTIESLLKWAETEDHRERVKNLQYRFRHHRTRCANALAEHDG